MLVKLTLNCHIKKCVKLDLHTSLTPHVSDLTSQVPYGVTSALSLLGRMGEGMGFYSLENAGQMFDKNLNQPKIGAGFDSRKK